MGDLFWEEEEGPAHFPTATGEAGGRGTFARRWWRWWWGLDLHCLPGRLTHYSAMPSLLSSSTS